MLYLERVSAHFRSALSISFLEHVFFCAADGTNPSVREVFKGSSRCHTVVRVPIGWIINITANRTPVFLHPSSLLYSYVAKRIAQSRARMAKKCDCNSGLFSQLKEIVLNVAKNLLCAETGNHRSKQGFIAFLPNIP